jgi:hypothetical protein
MIPTPMSVTGSPFCLGSRSGRFDIDWTDSRTFHRPLEFGYRRHADAVAPGVLRGAGMAPREPVTHTVGQTYVNKRWSSRAKNRGQTGFPGTVACENSLRQYQGLAPHSRHSISNRPSRTLARPRQFRFEVVTREVIGTQFVREWFPDRVDAQRVVLDRGFIERDLLHALTVRRRGQMLYSKG